MYYRSISAIPNMESLNPYFPGFIFLIQVSLLPGLLDLLSVSILIFLDSSFLYAMIASIEADYFHVSILIFLDSSFL